MDDFQIGYEAYEDDQLYDPTKSQDWKSGYVKSIEDTLNDIFQCLMNRVMYNEPTQ